MIFLRCVKRDAHSFLYRFMLIMKITVFFIMVLLLQAVAETKAQKITLRVHGATLQEVMTKIQRQQGHSFFFLGEQIAKTLVDAKVEQADLAEAMEVVLAEKGLDWYMEDKTIVIKRSGNQRLSVQDIKSTEVSQQHRVSGRVTDEQGAPLEGVTVRVVGGQTTVVTDLNGRYSIDVSDENGKLAYSIVGFESIELPIDGESIIDVSMKASVSYMDEVVVVGYGTQKKVNLTGAIGVAGSERLENRTITSAGQGLQGVVPGLNITFNSGDPNQAADFNIRGFESINGGAPLILVDGVPMDVEKINPNDIKSVSVLKDASSAAIYGARAAFGVILVETKKGLAGKTRINFSTQTTLQKAIFPGYEPVRDGGTARQIQNEANKITTGRELLPQPVIDAALAYQELENPTVDDAWMYYEGFLYPLENTYMKDLALRDFAPQQQYDFSISGASERASYYVSAGMINKDGFFRYGNEKYKRYNVLSKIDFQVNDWLALDNKIAFSSVLNNLPHNYGDQWYYQSIAKHFYSPHTFPDLTYYIEPGDHDKWAPYIGMGLDNRNPLPYLKNGGRDLGTDNDIWLTQGITITPLKGLKIRGDFSYRYFWSEDERVASQVDVLRGFNGFEMVDDIVYKGQSANDWIESGFAKNTYYVFNTFAEYVRDDLGDHYFKVLAGFNQEYGMNHGVVTRSTQLLSPLIPSLSATTGTRTNSDSKNEVMLRGVFYRLNYVYKDKYLFEANGRYDGTSRFPSESRFGFFPSVSVGWRVSEEPFMDGTSTWLDNLKIRASYGQLGNQNVGSYYPYISSMSPGTSTFLLAGGGNLTNFIAPGGLVSNTLTWESVSSQNIGVDFTVKNKLDVEFDYFIRDTRDMLMEKSYPGTLGAAAPSENAADLRNKGWELSVTWRDKVSSDWSYRINLSLSDYQTEITKYNNPTGAIGDYYVGKKVGEIWGYKTEGLFQTTEELENAADQSRLGSNWRLGDVHYADLDNNGEITTGTNTLDDTGDRIRIGNTTPRYAFGINPSVKYKNFRLDVFAQGILKRDLYPSRGNFLRFWPFKSLSMEQWWIDDSWSPENPNAYFPLKQFAYSDNKNTFEQTRYLQNAAYMRLKNVTLSYDIPVKFASNAQVYLNGTNLFVISGTYKTLDPEYSSDLVPRYMFQKSFTLGLRVTL